MENQWYMLVKFRMGILGIKHKQKESLFKQGSREFFRIFNVI